MCFSAWVAIAVVVAEFGRPMMPPAKDETTRNTRHAMRRDATRPHAKRLRAGLQARAAADPQTRNRRRDPRPAAPTMPARSSAGSHHAHPMTDTEELRWTF